MVAVTAGLAIDIDLPFTEQWTERMIELLQLYALVVHSIIIIDCSFRKCFDFFCQLCSVSNRKVFHVTLGRRKGSWGHILLFCFKHRVRRNKAVISLSSCAVDGEDVRKLECWPVRDDWILGIACSMTRLWSGDGLLLLNVSVQHHTNLLSYFTVHDTISNLLSWAQRNRMRVLYSACGNNKHLWRHSLHFPFLSIGSVTRHCLVSWGWIIKRAPVLYSASSDNN